MPPSLSIPPSLSRAAEERVEALPVIVSLSLSAIDLVSSKMLQYPVESWSAACVQPARVGVEQPLERVERMASRSAVVVFSVSSCCMCHAVKSLFCGMGVSPTVYELDQDPRGKEIERVLACLLGAGQPLPAVFIGGKLLGPMDRVMASHINGSLVPLLKEAGALWL